MIRSLRALLLASALLASPALAQTSAGATAQGEPVTRVVVFGDSLSDGGFFLTVDPRIPREAGSFTTNPDPVAPEVAAAQLGLDLLPVYGRGGTNYAIGGARVTAPNGITIPIATQVTNFLNAGGTFRPTDLVYIQGGGNDFFAFQAGGGRDNAILTNAANQLAATVRRIQDAGGERIVTFAIQSSGQPGIALFNQTYASALAAANVNALYFRTDLLFNEIVANAASFGITNVTGTACTGSSLTCTRANLVAPNANETYLLADSVHPAGITQRIQGQAVAHLIKAPEQVAGLAYSGQALFRSQRDLFEGAERGTVAREGGGAAVFGGLGYHYFSRDGSTQRVGLDQRGLATTLGVDFAASERVGLGVVGGYSDVDGDFEGGQGAFDAEAWSVSGYARLGVGPVRLLVDGSYGQVEYDDISRRVVLGPTFRESSGQTDGDYYALRGVLGADLLTAGELAIGPDVAVAYERLTIDGYAESGTRSTDASYGRQRLKSLTGRFGAAMHSTPGSLVRFAARAGYEREFEDEGRLFTITPVGAPISYTTAVARADRDYLSFAASADGSLGNALSVRGGVSGQVLRRDMDSVTAFAGLSLAF